MCRPNCWACSTPTPPRIPGVPSKTTLWRVLTGVDACAVDAAIGSWLAEQAHHTSAVTGARAPDTGPVGRADPADGTDGTDGTDEAVGSLLAAVIPARCLVPGPGRPRLQELGDQSARHRHAARRGGQ